MCWGSVKGEGGGAVDMVNVVGKGVGGMWWGSVHGECGGAVYMVNVVGQCI